MNRAILSLLLTTALASVGCRQHTPPPHVRRAFRPPRGRDSLALRDSARLALRAPRVVRAPTVVVFWLAGGDTLAADDANSAYDDLSYYTEQIASVLKENGIVLVPTNSDTVFIDEPNHKRRTVILSGLDYPYGYLLIDPGGPERILTGIYSDDDLLDEVQAYFDFGDDSIPAIPRVTT